MTPLMPLAKTARLMATQEMTSSAFKGRYSVRLVVLATIRSVATQLTLGAEHHFMAMRRRLSYSRRIARLSNCVFADGGAGNDRIETSTYLNSAKSFDTLTGGDDEDLFELIFTVVEFDSETPGERRRDYDYRFCPKRSRACYAARVPKQ